MSIRRWLAEKLCPELVLQAIGENVGRLGDSELLRQYESEWMRRNIVWYAEPLKKPQPNVRIELTGSGQGQIYLEGVRQQRVVGFSLEVRVGKPNLLKIDYDSTTAIVSGDVEVADGRGRIV